MIDQWLRSLLQPGRDDDLIKLCGSLMKRELTMPGCTDDDSICKRQYDLYVPSSACDHVQTNILPLMFAVHCYGCHPNVMSFLTAFAETYNFVSHAKMISHQKTKGVVGCGKWNVLILNISEALLTKMSVFFRYWSFHMESNEVSTLKTVAGRPWSRM